LAAARRAQPRHGARRQDDPMMSALARERRQCEIVVLRGIIRGHQMRTPRDEYMYSKVAQNGVFLRYDPIFYCFYYTRIIHVGFIFDLTYTD
jgi:predicted metal-dependent phosphotriesterase family hydrolase